MNTTFYLPERFESHNCISANGIGRLTTYTRADDIKA